MLLLSCPLVYWTWASCCGLQHLVSKHCQTRADDTIHLQIWEGVSTGVSTTCYPLFTIKVISFQTIIFSLLTHPLYHLPVSFDGRLLIIPWNYWYHFWFWFLILQLYICIDNSCRHVTNLRFTTWCLNHQWASRHNFTRRHIIWQYWYGHFGGHVANIYSLTYQSPMGK